MTADKKEGISAEEWRSNQAALRAVRDEDSAQFRLTLKRKIAGLFGAEYVPENAKAMTVKMAKFLVENGLLDKPTWHDKSTLHLDLFMTEDLAVAYTRIKQSRKAAEPEIDPDNCPF
jgi:hypothetical protein